MQMDVGGISPVELADRIAVGTSPTLIDVCIDEDFASDPALVPGARRQRHRDIESDRDTVVICQRGLKLSMGAAALLRSKGYAATHLIGGNVAWREKGLPRLKVTALPPSRLWVTAQEVINCALVKFLFDRFLGDDVHIMVVSASECEAVAERFDAELITTPEKWLGKVGLDTSALLALAAEAANKQSSLHALLQAAVTLPRAEAAADTILSAAYATHRKAGTL